MNRRVVHFYFAISGTLFIAIDSMGMQQIHGFVHVAQLQPGTGGQIDLGQPAIPDTEFGVGVTQAVGGHGQQSAS